MKVIQNYEYERLRASCIENCVMTTDAEGSPVSYKYDLEWDFSKQVKFARGTKEKKVSFKGVPEIWRRSVQDALSMFMSKNVGSSVQNLRWHVGSLTRIVKHLNSDDWALLDSDEHYRQFIVRLIKSRYSRSTLGATATTINILRRCGLTTRSLKPKKFAEELKGKMRKQHIAIPEGMAKLLFSSAIELIDEWHPKRHQLSRIYAEYHKGGCTDDTLLDIDFEQKHCQLLELQAGCAIIIHGFTGARWSEVRSFLPSGYELKEYSIYEVPIIHGQLSKTEGGNESKDAYWVTHPIVKKAMELVYDMSDFARDFYRELYCGDRQKLEEADSLFLSLSINKHQSNVLLSETSLLTAMKRFAHQRGIVATDDDVTEFDKLNPDWKGMLKVNSFLPKFSTHDFRRTFAVFLVRNRLGNLITLKHQYKHLNQVMAALYANYSDAARVLDIQIDKELMSLIEEANINMAVDMYIELYNSPTLSGIEGKRIIQERENKGFGGDIYKMREDLERQVRAGVIAIVDTPNGYCINKKCSRICSSILSMKTCQHEVITPQKARAKLPLYQRLITRFERLKELGIYMVNVLTQLALEIETLQKLFSEHSIKYEDYMPDLNHIIEKARGTFYGQFAN